MYLFLVDLLSVAYGRISVRTSAEDLAAIAVIMITVKCVEDVEVENDRDRHHN